MPRKLFQRVLLSLVLLLILLLNPIPPRTALSASVGFSGIPVGQILDKQIPGVTFLKYRGMVSGVVVDSPSGRVASFNVCDCEFVKAGANMAFSSLQRSVTLHVGLLPTPSGTVQRDLTLTAFDPAGVVRAVATANVTSGAGFGTALTVTIATPEIATVVLEAINDIDLQALVAVQDITFEEVAQGGGDFILDIPRGATVLQDGPPLDVPITIHRFEPSTGDINFSVSGVPAGVNASVIPSPTSGNSATLHLEAHSGPAPETKTLIITGSPSSPSVGPAPRSTSIELSVESKLRVTGPADIDFAGCAPDAAHGTVTRDYSVIRDFRVTGPIQVDLQDLPADVTGTVSLTTLDFPGFALGQRVTVTLKTIAGSNVPDTWVALHLTGPEVDLTFPILIHGTCPQQNRNFVIRGSFWYINAGDSPRPMRGAQVEIYRHRSDWFDDRVDVTYTNEEGSFTRDEYASNEGEYYARVRLASEYEVQVEDAENSSVWSTTTERRSNRGGLIDLGALTISRDDGAGTPRAAVWQGFREADREFRDTTGRTPPGGYLNVIVFRGHVYPIAYYNQVHWPHGHPTGNEDNRYWGTTHEFAHVFRDVFDGSQFHWNDDNSRYMYGREHDRCDAKGLEANAGFAFHEGWGEYWSGDIKCCKNDLDNQNLEGTVAADLFQLEACTFVDATGSHTVGRNGMVQVLARGENLIHSLDDFRREYAKQFPACSPLPNIRDWCVANHIPRRNSPPSPFLAVLSLNRAKQPDDGFDLLDPAKQRNDLVAAINSREETIATIKQEQNSSSGLRSFALRAAVEEANLIVQRMRDDLAEFDRGGPQERFSQRGDLERQRRNEFIAQRKAIQTRALRDALAVVPPEQSAEINRRLLLLKESRIDDPSIQSRIILPPVAGDDSIATVTTAYPRWLILTLLALAALLAILVAAFFRFRKA